MATFRGSVTHTWTTAADPAAALDFFASLDANVRHNLEIARHERLDDRTVRLVLREQRSGRTTFEPRYTVRYTADAATGTLRWETPPEHPGTMTVAGVARFEGPPGGPTTIHWDETVEPEVPVNRLVAKAVAPVAEGLIRKGIRDFVARMIADLEGRG